MASFSLYLAARYLRPKRTFSSVIPLITVCGVTLGVAILMIVLAVMTGFGDVWREKILSFKPHVVVRSVAGTIEEPERLSDEIARTPSVTSVCPAIVFPAMLRRSDGGDPVSVTVFGIDPSRGSILGSAADRLINGRFDVTEDRAMLGCDLAWRLRVRSGGKLLCYSPLNLRSADELYFPEELTVAGVYDMGMRDFDDGIVVCSLGMARDLLGMDGGATFLQVQTKDPQEAWKVREALEASLGPGFAVSTWTDEDAVLFEALRTEKTMMFVLLAFIAIVAAFCVTNTLLVITIQKTREIGLLKALGFSRRKIRGVFLTSGLVQCAIGEGLGIALGSFVLHHLQDIVALLSRFGIEAFRKETYGLPELPWRIVGFDVAAVVGVVFLFCFLASFLPATFAARLDPVKAIQQE